MYVNNFITGKKKPQHNGEKCRGLGLLVFPLTEERWLGVAISKSIVIIMKVGLGLSQQSKKEMKYSLGLGLKHFP